MTKFIFLIPTVLLVSLSVLLDTFHISQTEYSKSLNLNVFSEVSNKNSFPVQFLEEIKLNMDPDLIIKELGASNNESYGVIYSNGENSKAKILTFQFTEINLQFYIQFNTVIAYSIELNENQEKFSLPLFCTNVTLGESKFSDIDKVGSREYFVKHRISGKENKVYKSKYLYARFCNGGGTVYYGLPSGRDDNRIEENVVGKSNYKNLNYDWIDDLIINSITVSMNQTDSEFFGNITIK